MRRIYLPDAGCLLSGMPPPSLAGLSGSISMHPELHHRAKLCTILLRLSVLTREAMAKDGSASGKPEIFQLTVLWALHCLGEEGAVPLLPSLLAAL